MTKNMLRAVMAAVFFIGSLLMVVGVDLWTRTIVYNPDMVVTVHNDTTDKNTQAYGIGKMRVYIDQTYRMDMPLWEMFIKSEGMYNDPNFDAIQPGMAELVLNHDDESINPNPFIMRLKIMNVSDENITINADNFMIRNVQGDIIKPNHAWQEVMAKANIFSGVLDKTEIKPDEEKVLWLVYGTKTQEQEAGYAYQEFVRINYDSDSDFFATKVEFPFNYTESTPIGNYTDTYDYMYLVGFLGILAWLGICGAVYYRKAKEMDEDEE